MQQKVMPGLLSLNLCVSIDVVIIDQALPIVASALYINT